MAHEEYRRHVDGSKTIVLFIHGILGSPDQFNALYSAVPESCSIVSLLLDGHGGTVRDFSRTSMTKWKAQVSAEVEELALRYNNIIIVGHSMGTFLAMDAARQRPEKVKGLFLLCVPLVIGMTIRASVNSMKVIFTNPPDKSAMTAAARAAYSIQPDKRLWRYIGWIPRYLELFREARAQRKLIAELDIPCKAYHSSKDELVSKRSCLYLAGNPSIAFTELPQSSHSCFHSEDMERMVNDLREICSNI